MSPLLWLSVAGVCALGAMSPGPSLAVVIRNTIGRGRTHGLATSWAHALGVGFYALLTTFGLAEAITRSRPVYLAVSVTGAIYLFYLGIQAWRSGGDIQAGGAATPTSVSQSAREGFLIAFMNPKVAVFLLAVFSQLLRPTMGTNDHLVMSAIATLMDGLWYSIVTLLLTRAGWLDRLRRQARRVERITGTVLILLAAAGVAHLITG